MLEFGAAGGTPCYKLGMGVGGLESTAQGTSVVISAVGNPTNGTTG